MVTVRNIYCVGRNYALHAAEMGSAVPKSPMFFSKPTHALVEANGGVIQFPSDQGEIHYEAELVIYIGNDYRLGMKTDDLVTKMSLGIDFTLRDLQSQFKEKGHPWLLSKGFPNSAALTQWIDFPGEKALRKKSFSLFKNGEKVQEGNVQEMIFDLQTLIEFCAHRLGLGKGDILYTGTPAGVGRVANGDRLQLFWGKEELGACEILIR